MSVYHGLFYIHEEKRFARWEEYIEKRLEEGSEKFKKLEMLLWGVYPFMIVTIVASKFL